MVEPLSLFITTEFIISTGIVFYIDGLKNLYRRDIDLAKPVISDMTALQILHSRFKNRGIIAGFVLTVPDRPEYLPVIEQARELGIDVCSFAAESILEKPVSLQQQRWGLEDDSGNDTLVGAALAQAQQQTGWKTLVMIPVVNLLVEPAEVYRSLDLYRREEFDACFADERVAGAGWSIFRDDLLIGLMRSHADIMWARGGFAWALKKPLYPFKIGAWHCPRIRPRLAVDLRLNSERALSVYAEADSKDFADGSFSYEGWLTDSGWEKSYCDFGPLQINLEPTNECQADCFACPHAKMQRPRSFLPMPFVEQLAGEFAPGDDVSWLVSGMGEPLLHEGIAEILRLLSAFRLTLHTSLQKLPEPAEFPWFAIDHLRMSIDALAREDFEKSRPGCSWDNIEKFLAFARERKKAFPDKFPEIGVTMLRHAMTEGALQPFLRYWKQVAKPVFRENFFRWPFELPPEPVQWFQILGEAEYGHLGSRTSQVDFTPVRRRPCRHALLTATVLADGSVTICPFDHEGRYAYGDLKKQTLKEIWHLAATSELRQKHLLMEFSDNLPCASCRDWYHPL